MLYVYVYVIVHVNIMIHKAPLMLTAQIETLQTSVTVQKLRQTVRTNVTDRVA